MTHSSTHSWSRAALIGSWLTLVALAFWYYPKWQQPAAEATISWDVSGYYWYLPSFLIYEDARGQGFAEDLLATYRPTNLDLQQVYLYAPDTYVMKYPMGQALQFLPFFAGAHLYATLSPRYPADGFSRPYQVAITIEFLLVALLGLWALRRWLLRFVDDRIAALTLLLIALGTNYTEYAGITGAMTHNNLFTIHALLLLLMARYAERPGYAPALGMGLLVGLAALTRPTEILIAALPLGWGALTLMQPPWQQGWQTLRPHLGPLLLGGLGVGLVGMLQLLYWYWATGEWLVYSYQDQGFDWLSPHITNGLLSYRSGWWTYTPLMVFPFLGFGLYWQQAPRLALASAGFMLLFMYVAFAWSIWWYGGSLGQRTMVSTYPTLAVPLALLLAWVGRQHRGWQVGLGLLLLLCTALNLFWTHHAHRGGLLKAGWMNGPYFWHVLGRFEQTPKGLRLLDTPEVFEGERTAVRLLWSQAPDTLVQWPTCGVDAEQAQALSLPYEGPGAACLRHRLPYEGPGGEWLRASLRFRFAEPVWSYWHMRKLVLVLRHQGKIVKYRRLAMDRYFQPGQPTRQYLDIQVPTDQPVDTVEILLHNVRAPGYVGDLRLEQFQAAE